MDVAFDGFTIVPDFLSDLQRDLLGAELGAIPSAGQRGLLANPNVRAFASSEQLLDLVRPHCGGAPQPVRAIFFDKSPETNWLVPWHQDLTIAVCERVKVAGFGPWSMKDGIVHVQPPAEILEQMVTVRLHLDDTDESNGALKVMPGSHRNGKLSPGQIAELRQSAAEELTCAVRAKGALVMRPLLLHASARSKTARRRRVLHIEYAAISLPHGLRWNLTA